jgi:hypothetical protein
MKLLYPLMFASGLAAVGCQSTKPTAFAPFDARLERVSGGGAQHFVLVNASGREFHNLKFSAYMWDAFAPALYRHNPVVSCSGSGKKLGAGETLRFHKLGETGEVPILISITHVELIGHCDEGRFHQFWRKTYSGQLEPVNDRSSAAKPSS